MPGSLQHHHHRGHFDERQVVGRLLLVPRRHPPVLLDLRPEPLAPGSRLPVQGAGRSSRCSFRSLCVGITAAAPRRSISATSAFLSYPLSAITAPGSWSASSASAWAMSDSWAAVRSSSTGCPRPSKLPWTLVPKPPRLRPRACSAWPPDPSHFFSTRRRTGGPGRRSSRGSGGRGRGRGGRRGSGPIARPWPSGRSGARRSWACRTARGGRPRGCRCGRRTGRRR